jgi:hypothetical protein
MLSFTSPAANVTETGYPKLKVLANWSDSTPYPVDGYGVAPSGFLARTTDGSVVAGSFSGTFDGTPISDGTHHLLVTRTATTVTVHQPLGDDTELAVRLPSSWQAGQEVHVSVLPTEGRTSTPVESTVQGGRVVFKCGGPQPGLQAPTYLVSIG